MEMENNTMTMLEQILNSASVTRGELRDTRTMGNMSRTRSIFFEKNNETDGLKQDMQENKNSIMDVEAQLENIFDRCYQFEQFNKEDIQVIRSSIENVVETMRVMQTYSQKIEAKMTDYQNSMSSINQDMKYEIERNKRDRESEKKETNEKIEIIADQIHSQNKNVDVFKLKYQALQERMTKLEQSNDRLSIKCHVRVKSVDKQIVESIQSRTNIIDSVNKLVKNMDQVNETVEKIKGSQKITALKPKSTSLSSKFIESECNEKIRENTCSIMALSNMVEKSEAKITDHINYIKDVAYKIEDQKNKLSSMLLETPEISLMKEDIHESINQLENQIKDKESKDENIFDDITAQIKSMGIYISEIKDDCQNKNHRCNPEELKEYVQEQQKNHIQNSTQNEVKKIVQETYPRQSDDHQEDNERDKGITRTFYSEQKYQGTQRNQPKKQKHTIRCNYCNEKGHKKRYCPYKTQQGNLEMANFHEEEERVMNKKIYTELREQRRINQDLYEQNFQMDKLLNEYSYELIQTRESNKKHKQAQKRKKENKKKKYNRPYRQNSARYYPKYNYNYDSTHQRSTKDDNIYYSDNQWSYNSQPELDNNQNYQYTQCLNDYPYEGQQDYNYRPHQESRRNNNRFQNSFQEQHYNRYNCY